MIRLHPAFPAVLLAALATEAQAQVYSTFGDSAGDRFGFSAAGCGDVNGDGVPDFVAGAYLDDASGTDAGAVRVYSGADGSQLHAFFGEAAGDWFGYSVAGAGDVNRDGFQDVIVGAPRVGNNGADSGGAKIFSGVDGAVLHAFNGPSALAHFGWSVSSAGDVNQDGRADVIVGAWGANLGVWVHSGLDGQVLASFGTGASSDYFGWSVHGGRDINRDGWPDYLIGAPRYEIVGTNGGYGFVRAISGKDNTTLWTGFGSSIYARLGESVAIVGDVDGDSKEDFAAAGAQELSAGEVIVFSGATGAVIWSQEGSTAEEELRVVAPAGDVDGDGVPDVLLGAPLADLSAADSGTVRAVSGVDGTLLAIFRGSSAGARFGTSAWTVGDLTGDGLAEIVVGEPENDTFGSNAGRVVVLDAFVDCNANGIHDGRELVEGLAPDCNGNSVPDECDIAAGVVEDCNGNGIPEECEPVFVDCDGNGIPDDCDVVAGRYPDCNANGVPDPCEVALPAFRRGSGTLTPLASSPDHTWVVFAPPLAFGPVRIELTARGDLGAVNEFVTVRLNGVVVGNAFIHSSDCVEVTETLTLDNRHFNDLVAGGNATFVLDASLHVLGCNNGRIAATLTYGHYAQADCNENGTDDVCDLVLGVSEDVNASGVPDECEFENFCAPAPNSTGAAAQLSWSGSNSVSSNDLILIAFPLPPGQNGLFIYSPDQAYSPLGDGFLCLGNQTQGFINRLPFEASNGSGTISHALDVTAPPVPISVITAGSTWHFQCWFRDVPAGGTGFNFSDGLSVLFLP